MNRTGRTVVMVMAGGKGQRLVPLTAHRAKPSVPFGGRYRIIDFVLSNLLHSGYRQVYVLTQYMASSLIRHLNRTWHLSSPGEFIEVVPAQMRRGDYWYRGTADSVYQNINLVYDTNARHVAVFGGDHIYKFDVSQMEDFHREQDAHVTIAAYPVSRREAARTFGVFEVDAGGRLIGFEEKPEDPKPIPGRPDMCLVSMGNYFFEVESLRGALADEARDPRSPHDFGKGIIPRMLREGRRVAIYDSSKNVIPGEPEGAMPYWRDVGTLDSYFDANMDVRSPLPMLNLYNFRWHVRTAQRNFPPARFVKSPGAPDTAVLDSLVCEGTIVISAALKKVVSGYDCFFHAGADVENCVILSGCDIGAGSRLKNVLLDKNCSIAPGTVMGEDPAADRERFPFITEAGRIVLPKGTHVPKEGPIELAQDIETLLRLDPGAAKRMKEFEKRYTVSDRDRHSHLSVGPRFHKFGREGLE